MIWIRYSETNYLLNDRNSFRYLNVSLPFGSEEWPVHTNGKLRNLYPSRTVLMVTAWIKISMNLGYALDTSRKAVMSTRRWFANSALQGVTIDIIIEKRISSMHNIRQYYNVRKTLECFNVVSVCPQSSFPIALSYILNISQYCYGKTQKRIVDLC